MNDNEFTPTSPPPSPLLLLPQPAPRFPLKSDFSDSGIFYSSPFEDGGILNADHKFDLTTDSGVSTLQAAADLDFGRFTTLLQSDIPGFVNGLLEADFHPLMNGERYPPTHEDLFVNDSGISSLKWDSPNTTLPGSQFDFSGFDNAFSNNGSAIRRTSNGSGYSYASADSSPTTLNNVTNTPANLWNQQNRSNAALIDDQESAAYFSNESVNWSPSQAPGAIGNNANVSNGPEEQWDETLCKLSKNEVMAFAQLLDENLAEALAESDIKKATKLQSVLTIVQKYIFSEFVEKSGFYGARCDAVAPVAANYASQPPPSLLPSPTENLDMIAKMHRAVAGSKDAPYTWSGELPVRIHKNPVYSSKIFLGGLPWDVTEATLMQAFKPYGLARIEWPGKEGVAAKPKGYAYAVFENERDIHHLLEHCTHDYSTSKMGSYYFKVSSKKYRCKDVQVIPWATSDSTCVCAVSPKIDPDKTIFVGALHGMVNAEGLAKIMNDLFGNVVYAGIDLDTHKYPIGSARVTFSSTRSYMKAVSAGFVLIKTARFEKKLQLDPFIDAATCSICYLQQGPYFCREPICFRYYCRSCFHFKHSEAPFRGHRPMMRTSSGKANSISNKTQQHRVDTLDNNIQKNSGTIKQSPGGPPNRNGNYGIQNNAQAQMLNNNHNGFHHNNYQGNNGGHWYHANNGNGHINRWNVERKTPQTLHLNNNVGNGNNYGGPPGFAPTGNNGGCGGGTPRNSNNGHFGKNGLNSNTFFGNGRLPNNQTQQEPQSLTNNCRNSGHGLVVGQQRQLQNWRQ